MYLAAMTAISVMFVRCTPPKESANAAPKDIKTPELVSAEGAIEIDLMKSITYNGNIAPYKTNNITSAMPLRIDEIFVEVGDMVKRGSMIAELDKNQVIQQELQLNNLNVDLVRMQELYNAGGVSKQQLDQLQLQYDVTKKAISYLKENATLLSPINGVVTARNYDKGDMFTQQPIVTVMQIDSVKVTVNISEEYFTSITKGMAVNITTDNYDKVFSGNISLIYPLVDAATRSFTVEVTIPNKDLSLRPGMYTNVSIDLGSAPAITIPDIAVQKQIGSNERYVFVVENGVASRRSVKVGEIKADRAEIVSGVNRGDIVITQGAGRLMDGDVVKIKK